MPETPHLTNIHIKNEGKRKKFPEGKGENTSAVNYISRHELCEGCYSKQTT